MSHFLGEFDLPHHSSIYTRGIFRLEHNAWQVSFPARVEADTLHRIEYLEVGSALIAGRDTDSGIALSVVGQPFALEVDESPDEGDIADHNHGLGVWDATVAGCSRATAIWPQR